MIFDTKAHIEKMQPAVNKLVAQLKTKGIEFDPNDSDGHENVTIKTKDKTIKISHHSFYRYSGIGFVYKDNKDNSVETIEVTDEMYLINFIKPIIDLLLVIKN